MGFGDIFKTIGKVALNAGAPILASAIPGGGTAMNLVKSAFGVDADQDDEGVISQAIAADPEAAVKLRQIEADNKRQLQEIALEKDKVQLQELQATLADKSSARQREIALTQATGKRDINLYVLVVLGFGVLLYVLMTTPLPEGAEGYINQLFGALAAGFGMVLSYFFGTSASSRRKDATIAGKGQSQ